MSEKTSELLRIEDLTVTYQTSDGDLPAVRGVSLRVDRGEIVGVAGESGCGKSTLASTILRLQPASARVEGRVFFEGNDVLTMRWGDLRAVRWAGASIVFQGALHSLNPVQRVGAQIAEAIKAHDSKMAEDAMQARIKELLSEVGLSGSMARSYPHQLSGGQRQRVMIAMALGLPAVPDRRRRADHRTRRDGPGPGARRLGGVGARPGVGMLIISHDLSVLADLCDRIAVMYAGRVVEEGPASRVFERPLHPYATALAAAFPKIGDPCRTVRLRPVCTGDPPEPGDLPAGCAFAPRCHARSLTASGSIHRSSPSPTSVLPLYPSRGGRHREHDLEAVEAASSLTSRGGAVAKALDGANLVVRPGEIVALVGESGSGKTTLARTLVGLQPWQAVRSSSTASRWSTPTGGLRSLRRRVQMVLQDPAGALNPRHTVYDSVAEGLRLHGSHQASPGNPRPTWWQRRCRRPDCVRLSACSCAIPTSCRAASASAS